MEVRAKDSSKYKVQTRIWALFSVPPLYLSNNGRRKGNEITNSASKLATPPRSWQRIELGHGQRRARLVDLRRKKQNTSMKRALKEERGSSRRLTRLRHELVLQREKTTTPGVVRDDADRCRRRGSAARGPRRDFVWRQTSRPAQEHGVAMEIVSSA